MAKIRTVSQVEPGKLIHKIEVYRTTKKPGTQGQRSKDADQKVMEFWAYIETLGGSVLEVFTKRFNQCSHRIHANWTPEFEQLHPKDRFVFGTKTFDIVHIDNLDFLNIKMEIIVSEIVKRVNASS